MHGRELEYEALQPLNKRMGWLIGWLLLYSSSFSLAAEGLSPHLR